LRARDGGEKAKCSVAYGGQNNIFREVRIVLIFITVNHLLRH
jgi:hypothetical protein